MKINWKTIEQWGIALFLFSLMVLMSASANWHFQQQKKQQSKQQSKQLNLNIK